MSIAPFKDVPRVDVGQSVTVTPVTGGMDTSATAHLRQGVSVRNMSDYGQTIYPILSNKGPQPNGTFDHTMDNTTSFGTVRLFNIVAEAGYFNGRFQPFDDIVGSFNPVQFIKDPGTQQYPVVWWGDTFLDPGMFNGIIEPLAIRHKMSNVSNDGPFPAHDIRASISPESGPMITGRCTFIKQKECFEPQDAISPFEDSQDTFYRPTGVDGRPVTLLGYDDPEERTIRPFDESTADVNPTEFSTLDDSFNDLGPYGKYCRSSESGFVYRLGDYNVQAGTGNRRVNGTDSLAFGGLIK